MAIETAKSRGCVASECREHLTGVASIRDIEKLAPVTKAVFVSVLTDDKLAALSVQLPGLRELVADGNNLVTDSGLAALEGLKELESLDLEWSLVTDTGLPVLARLPSLKYVDLGFSGVTHAGVKKLLESRPGLEVSGHEPPCLPESAP